MVIVFISCKDMKEAEMIASLLLAKHLVACATILPGAVSLYRWPPRRPRIVRHNEVLILAKSTAAKFSRIEREIGAVHSYTIPEIAAVRVSEINKKYVSWLKKELQ